MVGVEWAVHSIIVKGKGKLVSGEFWCGRSKGIGRRKWAVVTCKACLRRKEEVAQNNYMKSRGRLA
tara:strand:- start:1031 stop:1228 length:198 start_codon:yes stop_codon:yes gene_type:complete